MYRSYINLNVVGAKANICLLLLLYRFIGAMGNVTLIPGTGENA